jgi:hypothetical protein
VDQVGEGEGGEVMDEWDHLAEQDDASIWLFGSFHRKRIGRRSRGASVKCRWMLRPILIGALPGVLVNHVERTDCELSVGQRRSKLL